MDSFIILLLFFYTFLLIFASIKRLKDTLSYPFAFLYKGNTTNR